MKAITVKSNSWGVNEYLFQALITLGVNEILAKNASKRENNISVEYYYQLLMQNQLHTEKLINIDKRLDGVDTRLDNLDAKIDKVDAKIDKVETKLTAKIDKVDAKIDKVEAKLTANIDKVDAKIDKVEAKLTGEIKALDTKLTGEIKALDTKFDKKFDALSAIVMRNSEDISVLQSQMKLYFKIVFALMGASFVASSLIDLFFG